MNKINAEEFLKNTEENLFSTGFSEVDEFLQNAERGSIITIGARPSMGKTSFALSIVNHLLEQNKKIFYFSPALTAKAVTKRLIASKLQMYFFDLTKKFEEKKDEIVKTLEYFCEKELYISDKTNLTIEDIEAEIKENTPDIVFIDYIQLLKMPKAPNFTDSINLAVQELKRIAAETGVIFVILTQLSRAVEARCDKRPMLSDIRNSSLLEEISDAVLMIYRDEYYNPDNIENKAIAEIIFAKNSFGPQGIVSLLFTGINFKNRLKVIF